MHGHIGERARARQRHDAWFGSEQIDYDYHRERARRLRLRSRRQFARQLAAHARPLLAMIVVLATIWLMPTEDCRNCDPQSHRAPTLALWPSQASPR